MYTKLAKKIPHSFYFSIQKNGENGDFYSFSQKSRQFLLINRFGIRVVGGEMSDAEINEFSSLNNVQLAAMFDDQKEELRRMVQHRLDSRLAARIDPSDVLQDTFVTAMKKLESLSIKPAMPPWRWIRLEIQQMVIDLNRHHLAAEKRSVERESAIDSIECSHSAKEACPPISFDDGTSPSQKSIRNEEALILRAALQGLDSHDREILTLRHFEGMTNSEAAMTLEIAEKAASARYRRALKKLKEILEQVPGNGSRRPSMELDHDGKKA